MASSLKSWLETPQKKSQRLAPVLSTPEREEKELGILYNKLSRALHPWKTLYICSSNAQAMFVLTAKVSSLAYAASALTSGFDHTSETPTHDLLACDALAGHSHAVCLIMRISALSVN